MKRKKYRILFVFCLCSFLTNLYSAQLSPLAGEIMEDYQITRMQFTSLYMSTLIPTLCLAIPASWLVAGIGLKRCQCIGLVIGLVGLVSRMAAQSFPTFYLATICIGFMNIMTAAMSAAVLGQLFAKDRVGVAIGCIIASGASGKAIAELTTALLPSFRTLSIVDAGMLLAEIVICVFWMEDLPVEKKEKSMKGLWAEIIRNRYIWIAAVGLMLVFGLYTGISAHLPSILEEKGYDLVTAGLIASFISIGYFAGAIWLPKLISLSRKKKECLSALACICAAAGAGAYFFQNKEILMGCVFIIGFCTGGLLPTVLSIPATLLELDYIHSQAAGSLLSTCQLLGAVVIPAYVIVPLTGNLWSRFLIIAAGFMILEGAIFLTLPGSRQTKKG